MTTKFSKEESAQVGIGTMIVFIATILVAAVAAGVLIDTSQKLQDRSTATGNQATDDVGTAVEVLSVHGVRDATTDADLDSLRVQIRLAAGAQTISLEALKVNYIDADGVTVYSQGTQTTASQFGAFKLDGTTAKSTLSSGETALLVFGDDTQDLAISTASDLTLQLLPQVGHSVDVHFSTPNTYGTSLVFELY